MQWLPPAAAVRERYGLGNSRDRSLTRPPGPTARLVHSILREEPMPHAPSTSAIRVGAACILVGSAAPGGRLVPVPVDRAAPTNPTITEYQLPRENAFPHDPAVAKDGSVWYTDQANSYIGRLDPTTGKVVDYPTPTPSSGPHGIVVAPDGGIWYTGNAAGRLGQVDPATGAIREVVLPAQARDPHTPLIHQGKIWFTAQQSNLYGYLDPSTGKAKLFSIATPNAKPYGLQGAPDGSLWVALFGTNKLGRIDPATGALKQFP